MNEKYFLPRPAEDGVFNLNHHWETRIAHVDEKEGNKKTAWENDKKLKLVNIIDNIGIFSMFYQFSEGIYNNKKF